jgi:hypothetical protein
MTNPLKSPIAAKLLGAYRLSSLIWFCYSVALVLTAIGSQLLFWAETFRLVLLVFSTVTAIAMAVRVVAPAHPEWTRWTLPLMGCLSTSTFTLTLFAADMAGGFTAARLAYSLLLLTPALTAYLHWIGERLVRRT